MKAFITGSRRYGEPKEDSDVDLVVLCDADTFADMGVFFREEIEGDADNDEYDDESFSLKIGKLNLILCASKKRFREWRIGTELLERSKPVSRDTAKRLFRAIFSVKTEPEIPF